MKVVKRKDFLNLLAQSRTPKKRKLLVDWAGKNEIDAISELSLNTLNGNIKLNPKLFKKLQKHRNCLRLLASRKNNIHKKKRIVKQSGGFLNFLIPAALSAAISLLPK